MPSKSTIERSTLISRRASVSCSCVCRRFGLYRLMSSNNSSSCVLSERPRSKPSSGTCCSAVGPSAGHTCRSSDSSDYTMHPGPVTPHHGLAVRCKIRSYRGTVKLINGNAKATVILTGRTLDYLAAASFAVMYCDFRTETLLNYQMGEGYCYLSSRPKCMDCSS